MFIYWKILLVWCEMLGRDTKLENTFSFAEWNKYSNVYIMAPSYNHLNINNIIHDWSTGNITMCNEIQNREFRERAPTCTYTSICWLLTYILFICKYLVHWSVKDLRLLQHSLLNYKYTSHIYITGFGNHISCFVTEKCLVCLSD